jgi:hypothetical protein
LYIEYIIDVTFSDKFRKESELKISQAILEVLYDLIITSLHITVSGAVTSDSDNMVKILVCQGV